VDVWDLATGREPRRLDSKCSAFDVAFAPSGDLLAVAAASDTCQSTRVWDLRSGAVAADLPYRNVPDQTGDVHVLFFSADSHRLVVATGDHSVRIFDIQLGQQLSHLTFPDYPAAAAFVDGGRALRTVSQDGVLRTSTLDTNELLRQACAKVARDLTAEEWREYLGDEPDERHATLEADTPRQRSNSRLDIMAVTASARALSRRPLARALLLGRACSAASEDHGRAEIAPGKHRPTSLSHRG
jgi:hypothetical protein